MKIMKHLVIPVLLASIAIAPMAAFANDTMHGEKKADEMSKEFLDSFKATPDQRSQFEQSKEQFEAQVEPLHQQLLQKKQALAEYLATPEAEKTEAVRQQEDINQVQSQLGSLMIDHVFEKKAWIKEALKPDQQEKAQAYLQKKTDEFKKKTDEKTEELNSATKKSEKH
jgi:Spy/CpxP family protein refolding chaperone